MGDEQDLRNRWRGRGPQGPDRYQLLRLIGWSLFVLAVVDVIKAGFGY